MLNQNCDLIQYSFPLHVADSVWFAATGAFIEKAVLAANGVALSIFKPHYAELEEPSMAAMPTEVDLKFFGDLPFHGALARGCNATITLFCKDKRVPSLIFKPADKTVTWDTLMSPLYSEVVTAGSDAGEVIKTLVYTQDRCGFQRSS